MCMVERIIGAAHEIDDNDSEPNDCKQEEGGGMTVRQVNPTCTPPSRREWLFWEGRGQGRWRTVQGLAKTACRRPLLLGGRAATG